ncbi:RiPP maturation radical SAM C-methyltransferase [soil metagenome]
MKRVLLVNMPFAALDTPSLALGLFKTRLREDGIACDVQNLNFRFAEMVGYENYEFVLLLSAILGGEQLFARALFGDCVPPDSEYYREALETKSTSADVPARMEQIRRYVPEFLAACLEQIPWHAYDLIGFTSLFEQNLSSLSLARLVKERYPDKVIVFGGANCEDILGLSLHRCFPFVDFVCSGEADHTFPELVQRLKYHHPVNGLKGLVHRMNGTSVYEGPSRLIKDLEVLAAPNYDDYFEQLRRSPLRSRIRPSVLIESARGCWWGEKSHCTFCGLNGLTMAFRAKSVERTIREIEGLLNRYQPSIVRFVDNILSPSYFKDLLPEIARRGLKANYICEVKSNLKKHQIAALAAAGVTVQAGIENLSTHTLDLMGKGTNALTNIQTLKWCQESGVLSDWNMLYGFPGETREDYRRNAELAAMITHLHPPSGCGPIRLDRFSPNFDRAEDKGIINVRPLKFYKYLYPFDRKTLSSLVYYFDFDYREKIDDGGHIPALKETVERWKRREDYFFARRSNDGLILYDKRPVTPWPEMIIQGPAARIYEYCDRAQSASRIVEALREWGGPELTLEQVSVILEEFVGRRIMVREGNRYLSLAVLTYVPYFERQESAQTSTAPPADLVQVEPALSAAGH